jgi:hypothetical protein
MRRRSRYLWACALFGMSLTGCAKILTQQAIDRFAAGIQEKDLDSLRASSSPEFEQRALRLSDATQDLKVLKIPTDKAKIVKVQDVNKDERKVYVEVGKAAQKLEYRLVRSEETHQWVVDDVILPPKSTSAKTAPVSRSVAEQMDLLLSLREFLNAWDKGEREQILGLCGPDLRKELEGLPDPWLKQLCSQVVADAPKHKSLQPDARVDKDRAFLMLGKLVVEFRHIDGRWQLQDAATDAKDETVRSVRKLAGCLVQTQTFLTAYGSQIKTTLEEVTTPDFHGTCLAEADLDAVPLPVQALLGLKYDARQQKNRTEILLDGPGGIYMFTLVTGDLAPRDSTPAGSENSSPKVAEVTIFEKGGSQVKRLSSMFLSQQLLHVYADALSNRDKIRLEKMSTEDFRRRVWGRADESVLKSLPFPEVEAARPEVTATVFQGDVTEVTVTQGSRALTYVLHSTKSGLLVDDVLMPVLDRPSSLKANAEQLIPIYQFALGVHHGSMKALRQSSDDGLNKIVWIQLRSVPDFNDLFHSDVVKRLTAPVEAMRTVDAWSVVRIGRGRETVDVKLVKEADRYLVHDITFHEDTTGAAQVHLLRTFRNEIAASMQRQYHANHDKILPASAEIPVIEPTLQPSASLVPVPLSPTPRRGDAPGAVQPALYEKSPSAPEVTTFLEDEVEVRE